MHARALHALDGVDRSHQLAFERALLIDLLHKARRSEGLLVENLVAHDAGLRQAHRRELQPKLVNTLWRNVMFFPVGST